MDSDAVDAVVTEVSEQLYHDKKSKEKRKHREGSKHRVVEVESYTSQKELFIEPEEERLYSHRRSSMSDGEAVVIASYTVHGDERRERRKEKRKKKKRSQKESESPKLGTDTFKSDSTEKEDTRTEKHKERRRFREERKKLRKEKGKTRDTDAKMEGEKEDTPRHRKQKRSRREHGDVKVEKRDKLAVKEEEKSLKHTSKNEDKHMSRECVENGQKQLEKEAATILQNGETRAEIHAEFNADDNDKEGRRKKRGENKSREKKSVDTSKDDDVSPKGILKSNGSSVSDEQTASTTTVSRSSSENRLQEGANNLRRQSDGSTEDSKNVKFSVVEDAEKLKERRELQMQKAKKEDKRSEEESSDSDSTESSSDSGSESDSVLEGQEAAGRSRQDQVRQAPPAKPRRDSGSYSSSSHTDSQSDSQSDTGSSSDSYSDSEYTDSESYTGSSHSSYSGSSSYSSSESDYSGSSASSSGSEYSSEYSTDEEDHNRDKRHHREHHGKSAQGQISDPIKHHRHSRRSLERKGYTIVRRRRDNNVDIRDENMASQRPAKDKGDRDNSGEGIQETHSKPPETEKENPTNAQRDNKTTSRACIVM